MARFYVSPETPFGITVTGRGIDSFQAVLWNTGYNLYMLSNNPKYNGATPLGKAYKRFCLNNNLNQLKNQPT